MVGERVRGFVRERERQMAGPDRRRLHRSSRGEKWRCTTQGRIGELEGEGEGLPLCPHLTGPCWPSHSVFSFFLSFFKKKKLD